MKFSMFLVASSTLYLSVRALHVLYDVPVSNHGARVRMILKAKGIIDQVSLVPPTAIGGLKSPEFLNLNFQGKMPLLVSDEGLVISESDSISRFILDRYSEKEPTFIPKDCGAKYMSETIVRTHDLYISNLQGCMYKAPGTLFSIYGLDRKAALHELLRQLHGIDKTISEFRKRHSLQESYPFLCGNEISLADATLFPTMVFCDFMLPQFFGYKQSDFMGPVLREWYTHLSNEVSCAKEVQSEITSALMDWKSNGRWDAIVAEIK